MSTAVASDVVVIPEAPVRVPRKRWTRFILPVFTIAMIVYLAFPVLVMIIYSFNVIPEAGESERQTTQFTCCTALHWQQIFKVPELNHALLTSIAVAFPAAAVATVLGTFLGLVLARYTFRGRGLTNFVIFLAIAVPEIVLGSALAVASQSPVHSEAVAGPQPGVSGT